MNTDQQPWLWQLNTDPRSKVKFPLTYNLFTCYLLGKHRYEWIRCCISYLRILFFGVSAGRTGRCPWVAGDCCPAGSPSPPPCPARTAGSSGHPTRTRSRGLSNKQNKEKKDTCIKQPSPTKKTYLSSTSTARFYMHLRLFKLFQRSQEPLWST